MRHPREGTCLRAAPIALLVAAAGWTQLSAVSAQQAAATAPPGAPQSLAQRLGLYVFPAKGQTTTKQTADENQCFTWAETQSGIDPFAVTSQTASTQAPANQSGNETSNAGRGSAVRGTAGGAAIGAIAGNAGKGAAIGATVGVLHGAAARRRAEEQAQAQKQAEAKQQEEAQKQQQAQASQRLSSYNKAFSACLEGKGYTVK